MAASYLDVYRTARARRRAIDTGLPVLTPARAPRIAVVGMGSSRNDLDRAFASTEIRLWERTRNAIDRPVRYIRMTPGSLLAATADCKIDGALFQRIAIPTTMAEPLQNLMSECGIGYALDLDDDLLNVPQEKDPTGQYQAYTPTLKTMLKGARLVTVSTDRLAKRIEGEADRVVVVPNRVSRSLWGGQLSYSRSGSEVRALYMGTATHSSDFDMIRPALEAVHRSHPNFFVIMVGVTSEDNLPNWVKRLEIPAEAKSLARFVPWLRKIEPRPDFALAPLVDTEFNSLKSPLKLLDYAALGLPVLASDVSVYRTIQKPAVGVTLVANSNSAWETALKSQISSVDTAFGRGRDLRSWVFEHWSVEAATAEYDAMVCEVVEKL